MVFLCNRSHSFLLRMKWIKGLVITALAAYGILCAALYLGQERFIFIPDKLPADYKFDIGEEVNLEVGEGVALNCLWFKEPGAKGVILYLHGNRGSNQRCLRQAETMSGNGYDIFMPDYRSYGKSGGKTKSESQLQSDAQQVYDFLKKHYPEDRIVLVGYSLGSGFAAYLAANNHPQQLILLAPYFSMLDLKNERFPFVPDFILKYPLKSGEYLQKANLPVTLFHGKSDEVIPFESSEKLQAIRPGVFHLIATQDNHRSIIFNPLFRQTVARLLH